MIMNDAFLIVRVEKRNFLRFKFFEKRENLKIFKSLCKAHDFADENYNIENQGGKCRVDFVVAVVEMGD